MFAGLSLALFLLALFAVIWARELHRRAKELSREDSLTGVLSRRGFIEVLGDECKRSRRHLHPLTVVYVDLDDFKLVNDLLGHKTGDSVLRVVARIMQSTLREVDFVARLGGDEFALLLPETGAGNVRSVLDKLQNALNQTMHAKDCGAVTFSIGAVTFRNPLAAAEEMIAKADELMYLVKDSGKNRIEHLVLETPNQAEHLVRCSNCRTSFPATSYACPICRSTALLDLQAAEHNGPTQRGVQAYISNLEGELTRALRSLETILDILTDPAKLEHSMGDYILRLREDDLQKIAIAVGMPDGWKEANESGAAHRRVLIFERRVPTLRPPGLKRILPHVLKP